jgi:hypothetical protein
MSLEGNIGVTNYRFKHFYESFFKYAKMEP